MDNLNQPDTSRLEQVTLGKWTAGQKLRSRTYPEFGIPLPTAVCLSVGGKLVNLETGEPVNSLDGVEYFVTDYTMPKAAVEVLARDAKLAEVEDRQLAAISSFTKKTNAEENEKRNFAIALACGKGADHEGEEITDEMLEKHPWYRPGMLATLCKK